MTSSSLPASSSASAQTMSAPRAIELTKEQPCLPDRGGEVVGALVVAVEHSEDACGPLARGDCVTRDERQRRRVDERVVAAGPPEDVVVELGRSGGLSGADRF